MLNTVPRHPDDRIDAHRLVALNIEERNIRMELPDARVELREQVAIGATLPANVELQAVPSDWGPTVVKYRYVYSNDHVVLVEPSTRRVVQIVE